MKYLNKLHLGERIYEFGSPTNKYSIESELREWESHHSCLDELVLVEMLEKIEDKVNKLVKRVNKLSIKNQL